MIFGVRAVDLDLVLDPCLVSVELESEKSKRSFDDRELALESMRYRRSFKISEAPTVKSRSNHARTLTVPGLSKPPTIWAKTQKRFAEHSKDHFPFSNLSKCLPSTLSVKARTANLQWTRTKTKQEALMSAIANIHSCSLCIPTHNSFTCPTETLDEARKERQEAWDKAYENAESMKEKPMNGSLRKNTQHYQGHSWNSPRYHNLHLTPTQLFLQIHHPSRKRSHTIHEHFMSDSRSKGKRKTMPLPRLQSLVSN